MSTATKRLPLIDLPTAHQRHLGCLSVEQQGKQHALPLGAVDINANVADRVASVTVKQTFRNTFPEHLEAVYIFPLAGGCVVSHFEMHVGSRVVTGLVKERAQARVEYVAAVKEGKRAALLEQERDDVFTMQVGNIPPNEEITVILTYSERLPFFENGKTELRLPLVVAPRYMPGVVTQSNSIGLGTELDTDAVPDASRISPPRLVPGSDPKVRLSLQVELATIDSSGTDGIYDLVCSQHASQTTNTADAVTINLAREDERLNRDFVLQWRLATADVRSSLLVYKDGDGQSYGMVSITPPKRDDYVAAPRDVVFVLDRSGSMGGQKMISAARACALLLTTLGPNDRFAIQAFDNVVEWLALPGNMSAWQSRWVSADEAGLERGIKFLRSIEARGGTEMYMALNEGFAALKQRSTDGDRVPVLVVMTDGEVGNEAQILKIVQEQIAEARLFVVGIDTAANTGLLRRLANLGGGTSAFVSPGAHLEQALQSIGREIGTPVITDLEIVAEDGALMSCSQSPARIPDLFEGRAVTAYVQLTGKGALRVRGKRADGKAFEQKLKQKNVAIPAIGQLWAKSTITELEDSFRLHSSPQLRQQMITLACKHAILTKLTAFVAVDHAEITNKTGDLRQVVQPVETPAGWGQAPGTVADGFASAPSPSLPARGASSLMGQLGRGRSAAPSPQPGAAGSDWGSPILGSSSKLERLNEEADSSDGQLSGNFAESVRRKVSGQPPASEPAPSPVAPPPPPAETTAANRPAAAAKGDSAMGQSAPPAQPNAAHQSASPAQPNAANNQPAQPTQPSSPPPAQSSSPPHGGSPFRNFKISVENAFGNLFNAADRDSLSPSSDGAPVKASAALMAAYEAFCTQLEALYELLRTDTLPEQVQTQDFEKARKALLAALGQEACGMNVPLLQKFLRSAAVELIASLKHQTGTAAGARRIWDRHMQALSEARAEATTSLAGASSERRFWEASI